MKISFESPLPSPLWSILRMNARRVPSGDHVGSLSKPAAELVSCVRWLPSGRPARIDCVPSAGKLPQAIRAPAARAAAGATAPPRIARATTASARPRGRARRRAGGVEVGMRPGSASRGASPPREAAHPLAFPHIAFRWRELPQEALDLGLLLGVGDV